MISILTLNCLDAPKVKTVNDQIRLQDAKNTQVLDMAHQNAISRQTVQDKTLCL
jgi:predicted DNA-binding protein (UPF0251 family)